MALCKAKTAVNCSGTVTISGTDYQCIDDPNTTQADCTADLSGLSGGTCGDAVCSFGETCSSDDSACASPPICFSGGACTNGCEYTPIADGSEDSGRCDGADHCDGAGNCVPDSAPTCPDGACLSGEVCSADDGVCTTPPVCQTTPGACNGGTGLDGCVYANLSTGSVDAGRCDSTTSFGSCSTPPCECDGAGVCVSDTTTVLSPVCQTINVTQSNHTYYLDSSITDTSGNYCLNFTGTGVSNITLDCISTANSITKSSGSGVSFAGTISNVTVKNCNIIASTSSGASTGYGIRIQGSTPIVQSNSVSGFYPIYLNGSNAQVLSNNITATGAGISTFGQAPVISSNNVAIGAATDMNAIYVTTDFAIITGNIINTTNALNRGISLSSAADNANIGNNTITGPSTSAISIQSTNPQTSPQDNTCAFNTCIHAAGALSAVCVDADAGGTNNDCDNS